MACLKASQQEDTEITQRDFMDKETLKFLVDMPQIRTDDQSPLHWQCQEADQHQGWRAASKTIARAEQELCLHA